MDRLSESAVTEYLFAYGTLQPHLAPPDVAHLVRQMEAVGTGAISGTLYDLGSYPGAVIDAMSPRRITGTVFHLPDDPGFLAALDDYEDCFPNNPDASLFLRRVHPVTLAAGTVLRCWAYEYNRSVDHAPIIEGGVFSLK